MIKFITVISVFLLLAGCATAPKSAADAYQQTTVSTDEYTKEKWIIGPRTTLTFGLDGGGYTQLRRNGNLYQLYASTFSQLGWSFFQEAFDRNGKKLEFIKIDSRVGSGFTYEDFALTLTRKQLDEMLSSGLDVKIIGKRRSIILKVPAIVVEGFLKKSDATIDEKK